MQLLWDFCKNARMLTITPSVLCISDSEQEFILFNNAQKKVYAKVSSTNMTSYAYPTSIIEIPSLQQHQFVIKVLLGRQAGLNDKITVSYDYKPEIDSPRLLQISLTASAVTEDAVRKYGYELDYQQLLEEKVRLKKEISSHSAASYNIESEGTRLSISERSIDSEISSLNIVLGRELKDWKMRLERALRAFENEGFWILMFLAGFLIGLKW